MVSQPHVFDLSKFEHAFQETKEIKRSIALTINALRTTSAETRELIAKSREAMRRADELLKWH